MDGNGRWAKQQGLKRTKGHEKGAEVAREVTEFCAANKEIKNLILYTFSTENWKRPKYEVDYLMKLLYKYLKNEENTYLQNKIRFDVIGDLTPFSDEVKKQIATLKEKTKDFTGFTQYLALNYGAKDEITRALNKIGKTVSPETITQHLDFCEDIDIIIRTGGEKRISNFLLWQGAYAELFFSDTFWPRFSVEEFEAILDEYKNRERRFGGL
jgi:undecaprenyl diphosphate synthase